MKMPLVAPLSTVGNPELEELVKFFNETLGFCPNSVLTMQRRPNIAKAFVNLNMAVMKNEGRISSSLKRLIGYLSSYTAGCHYCQAHTIRAAERYGSEPGKLEIFGNIKPITHLLMLNVPPLISQLQPAASPMLFQMKLPATFASIGMKVRL